MSTITHGGPFCNCVPFGSSESDRGAPDVTDPNAIFRRYYLYIYRVAKNRVEYASSGDRAIGAEDVTQEAAATAARS